MANPNIATASIIRGETSAISIPASSFGSVVANASASGKVYKINLLMVSNVSNLGQTQVAKDVSARIDGLSSGPYYIAGLVAVPPDGTLILVGRENPLYLTEGCSISLSAESINSLHAICSYEVIS